MARVEADAFAEEVATELSSDLPDSYRTKHGFEVDVRQSNSLGLAVTVDGETSRVAAYNRIQVADDARDVRDVVLLATVEEEAIEPVGGQVEQKVRSYFRNRGLTAHPSPLTDHIRAGKYDGILEDEEPVNAYRQGTTPVSRFI